MRAQRAARFSSHLEKSSAPVGNLSGQRQLGKGMETAVGPVMFAYPYAPWCWNIYQHKNPINEPVL